MGKSVVMFGRERGIEGNEGGRAGAATAAGARVPLLCVEVA